jgi:phage protein D
MAESPHIAQFELNVNGDPIPIPVMDALLDCTIENSLHLPDVCTIRFQDADFKWLDDSLFDEGNPVIVKGGMEHSDSEVLFTGEITALEMDLTAHGVPTMVVRCYDRSHRLHRGHYNKTFQQMTDSDIVNQVGGAAGFSVQADSTSVVHDWVMQNNKSNWEFLQERAARNGYRLYLEGNNNLLFKKVEDQGDNIVELNWGEDLRSFRPRTAASPQVDQVEVRSWDFKQKQSIVGTSSEAKGIPDVNGNLKGGPVAKKAYGEAKMLVTDRPVHTQEEANGVAQSIHDDIGGAFLEAEGLVYGRPNLRPNNQIHIKNIGNRFSGKYLVTSTTHTYTAAEGFSTLFSVNGKQAPTLLGVLEGEQGGRRTRLGGNIVIAVVTDNMDPDDHGRVKVKYPWLTEEYTSFWARIAVPMAGSKRGFEFLPEIDDEVLVAFEHGDIERPFIIGALWNGQDEPIEGNSVAISGGKVNHRIIKTRIGHTMLFDDTDDTGEIQLKTNGEHLITMNDKEKKIMVKTKTGHTVLLDDDGAKIVIVDKTGSNKITIDSNSNAISAECMGDFSVNAQGKVSVQGQQGIDLSTPMQLSAEGQMGASIKGLTLDLEADTQASLKGSAEVTIQGGMVMIN